MIDQGVLISQQHKQIHFQNMSLDVTNNDTWCVWLLEINSNKFFVEFIVNEEWLICEFQIFGVKGYFELTVTIIKMIRNIVQNLYLLC